MVTQRPIWVVPLQAGREAPPCTQNAACSPRLILPSRKLSKQKMSHRSTHRAICQMTNLSTLSDFQFDLVNVIVD